MFQYIGFNQFFLYVCITSHPHFFENMATLYMRTVSDGSKESKNQRPIGCCAVCGSLVRVGPGANVGFGQYGVNVVRRVIHRITRCRALIEMCTAKHELTGRLGYDVHDLFLSHFPPRKCSQLSEATHSGAADDARRDYQMYICGRFESTQRIPVLEVRSFSIPYSY